MYEIISNMSRAYNELDSCTTFSALQSAGTEANLATVELDRHLTCSGTSDSGVVFRLQGSRGRVSCLRSAKALLRAVEGFHTTLRLLLQITAADLELKVFEFRMSSQPLQPTKPSEAYLRINAIRCTCSF